MMLVDVNIFMDVFQRRKDWEGSLALLHLVRQGKVKGCISALTVPILYFLRARILGDQKARVDVQEIIRGFQVLTLDQETLAKAFSSNFTDLEDAIQHFSAVNGHCHKIVTRNVKHYQTSVLPVFTPEEVVPQI